MYFRIGEVVEHILSKDWLLVLGYDESTGKYLCRMKNLKTDWFLEFELKEKKK